MLTELSKSKFSEEEINILYELGANFLSQGKFYKAEKIFYGLHVLNSQDHKIIDIYVETLFQAKQVKKALKFIIKNNLNNIISAKIYVYLKYYQKAYECLINIINNNNKDKELALAMLDYLLKRGYIKNNF
jgi:lipopolysaccharide biosynthesis regulator YciM